MDILTKESDFNINWFSSNHWIFHKIQWTTLYFRPLTIQWKRGIKVVFCFVLKQKATFPPQNPELLLVSVSFNVCVCVSSCFNKNEIEYIIIKKKIVVSSKSCHMQTLIYGTCFICFFRVFYGVVKMEKINTDRYNILAFYNWKNTHII